MKVWVLILKVLLANGNETVEIVDISTYDSTEVCQAVKTESVVKIAREYQPKPPIVVKAISAECIESDKNIV